VRPDRRTGLRWEEARALQKTDLEGNVLGVGSVLNEPASPHRWRYLDRAKTGDGRQIKIRPALAQRIMACSPGFLFLRPGRQHNGPCQELYCTNEAHIRGDWFRKQIWHPALSAIWPDWLGHRPARPAAHARGLA
jgi:hypothetical protein